MKKTAVVLLNLGGPEKTEDIEPFLKNLFSDPDIFKIPFGQKFLAGIIAKNRAPKVAENYKAIGGSPLNKWTEIQRKLLEEKLRKEFPNIDVFTAMRYWKPFTKDTAAEISRRKYERVILLPLFPHYSYSTTRSSINEWKRVFHPNGEEQIFIPEYYLHPEFIRAVNGRIDESLAKFDENARGDAVLVFSAHSTPVKMKKDGDPYHSQIIESVNEIMRLRKFDREYFISFQSKVGPLKWLEPTTEKTIKELAINGKKNMLIVPISFVSDHFETLFELDKEYRKTAEDSGVENYFVTQGLNDSELFINALKNIVKDKINSA